MKKAGLLFLVMIVIAVVAAGIGYWKLTGEESDTLRKCRFNLSMQHPFQLSLSVF